MSTTANPPVEISLAATSDRQREKDSEVLQPILTDLIAYSAIIKQLHWNLIGPNFRAIHLHLDEIYEVAQDAVDTVAERLSACGHSPTGTVGRVAQDTELKDVPLGFIRDGQAVILASHTTRELIGLIRSRMAIIEDIDTVTADILHQIVASLEKHHWMLEAQRV